MTKRIVLITFGTLGTVFLGLIVFGISVMGDRYCKIQLQNQRQDDISIKTVKATGNEWTMTVDSVLIKPSENFEIGHCINCSTLDKSDFDFDAIVIFSGSDAPRLIHSKDLPDYLGKLERDNCATFVVR
jgi:hypothetical protein